MKKAIRLLLVWSVLASITGCSNAGKGSVTTSAKAGETEKEAETGTETAKRKETEAESIEYDGTLAVALTADTPPYAFYQKEELRGIDIDILTEVAAALNLELVYYEMPHDAIVSAVAAGKADIGIGLQSSEEDAEDAETEGGNISFTDIYAKRQQVIVVKSDSSIDEAEDLNDLEVGVLSDSTAELLGEAMDTGHLYHYATVERALEKLKTDTIDALIVDAEQITAAVTGDDEIRLVEDAYEPEQYAFIVAADDATLLEQVNDTLSGLRKSKRLNEIMEQYIHVE